LHSLFLVQLLQRFALAGVKPNQRFGQQKRNNFVEVALFGDRDSTVAVFSDVIKHLIR